MYPLELTLIMLSYELVNINPNHCVYIKINHIIIGFQLKCINRGKILNKESSPIRCSLVKNHFVIKQ